MKRRSMLGRRNRIQQEFNSPAVGAAAVEATPKRNEERPSTCPRSDYNLNPFETPRNQVPMPFNNPSQDWSVFKHIKNWNTPGTQTNGRSQNRVSAELAALTKQWSLEPKASNCHTSRSTSTLNNSNYGKSPLEDTVVGAHSTPYSHNDLSKRVDSDQGSAPNTLSTVGNTIPSARRSLAIQNKPETALDRFTSRQPLLEANSCPTPLQIIREDTCDAGDSDIENRSPHQEEDESETTLQFSTEDSTQATLESDKLFQLLKEQCDIYNKMRENGEKLAEVDEERRNLEKKMEEVKQRKFILEEESQSLKLKMANQLKLVCGTVEKKLLLQNPESGARKSRSPSRSAKKRRPSVAVLRLPKQSLKPSKPLLSSHTPKRMAPLNKLTYTPRSLRKSVNAQLDLLYGE